MGMPFAMGVHVRGATSQFGGVTACLGIARMGCGSEVGLPVDEGAGCGLVKGNGGSLDPFECPSALGLVCRAGEHVSITLGLASEAGKRVPLAIKLAVSVVVVGLSDSEGVGWIGRTVVGSQGAAFVDPVRTGSMIMSPGTGLLGGMGVWLTDVGCMVLCSTGIKLSASLTSAAQSKRTGVLWIIVVLTCSPASAPRRSASRLLVLSFFSIPFASSSLPTPGSSLSCC